MDYEKAAGFLKALGHPARLKMTQGIANRRVAMSPRSLTILDCLNLRFHSICRH